MGESGDRFVLPSKIRPEDMLYVVDRDLRICHTNEEWLRFAGKNNGQRLIRSFNPHVLDNMTGRERARWQSIYHLLLNGSLPCHEEQFNCSSPSERRLYRLRITPQRDRGGSVAWLIHHTVRVDSGVQESRTLAEQIDALGRDFEQAYSIYRRQVIERTIEVDGFRVVKDVQPVEDVGGDFLWHRSHPSGVTDLIHGDAMGHGRGASLYAAKVLLVLDGLAATEAAPFETIASANQALSTDSALGFATGIMLRFQANSDRLVACAFAHNGMLFSRTGIVPIETGPPIGLTSMSDPWPQTDIGFAEHGRRFLLFSDGITEQFNEQGELYGVERLLEVFRSTESRPLEHVIHAVHKALEQHRGSAIIKDDRSLLAMEYTR